MKHIALVVAVFALPLVLAALAVGWALSGLEMQYPQASPSQQQPVASTASSEDTVLRVVAEEDVPGKDLVGLPRYPGSIRVEYRHEQLEGFARTRTEYVTNAGPDEIRTFYRRSFASEGWVVADLGFSPEEWYFFVVKDEREAIVQIHALRKPVVLEIELTGPDFGGHPPAKTRPHRPSVPARSPHRKTTEMAKGRRSTTTTTRAETTEYLPGGRSGSRHRGRWL